jgi:hypothetical protein
VNGNLLDGYPATAKALLSDPPPEIVKDVALKPSLRRVRDATVRLAQIKRQRDLELSKAIILDNNRTEFKAVDGLGEHKARIPVSVYFEMKRRCGDEYWEHSANIDEFLKTNPQYKIKIRRNTKGNLWPQH